MADYNAYDKTICNGGGHITYAIIVTCEVVYVEDFKSEFSGKGIEE